MPGLLESHFSEETEHAGTVDLLKAPVQLGMGCSRGSPPDQIIWEDFRDFSSGYPWHAAPVRCHPNAFYLALAMTWQRIQFAPICGR